MSLIENIERTVEEACAAESNVFGYGSWSHHITQVVENARMLAPHFDADREIVVLGALLHDYASIVDESLYEEHHIHGPRVAEQLLKQHDYPSERIERVKRCIAGHRGSIETAPDTKEGVCLASADGMAHIQQPHSLLYLAYVQQEMDIDEGADWIRTKLERSWQKIDPTVQKMVEDQCEAARLFLAVDTPR
ncbi:HD domain-containing protein [Halocatena marina]|uniref:HD domain-containing protein n=1 Tax=Halocatena marina TaxID=2934937 RepID=A0ABD5YS32_9EURY|nr:HD domain-containing protein [Halocatena marina]